MSTNLSRVSLQSFLLGFIAAAIAVLTVHQLIVYLLAANKILPASSVAWSMRPVPPYGIPQLVNGMFWGGLWGALFAVVWPKLPGGAMWLRGLVFGWLVALFSNWMLVPFIKGAIFNVPNQVYFAGGDPTRMMATLAIMSGFGATLGLIYGLLRSRQ
jgi:hypothetical protein